MVDIKYVGESQAQGARELIYASRQGREKFWMNKREICRKQNLNLSWETKERAQVKLGWSKVIDIY
jgi:hypothetical protein